MVIHNLLSISSFYFNFRFSFFFIFPFSFYKKTLKIIK